MQGLVEGEYADLSVEERLNALVSLVTVVNEGNAIRIALEVSFQSIVRMQFVFYDQFNLLTLVIFIIRSGWKQQRR